MEVQELSNELQAVFGGSLHTVALYGSAASEAEVAGPGDLHVLVIVDALPLGTLTDAGRHVTAWIEGGHPAPLVLTLAEWRSSSDIFPMEYADILAQRRELFGRVPLDGLRVDPGELRLAVEREAMGKLLQLRRGCHRRRHGGSCARRTAGGESQHLPGDLPRHVARARNPSGGGSRRHRPRGGVPGRIRRDAVCAGARAQARHAATRRRRSGRSARRLPGVRWNSWWRTLTDWIRPPRAGRHDDVEPPSPAATRR